MEAVTGTLLSPLRQVYHFLRVAQGNSEKPWLRSSASRPHHPASSPSPASREGSKSENVVLKLAWYGSELLGIAASLFRPSPPTAPAEEISAGAIGLLTGRAQVAEAIKEDFARSYFVTGNLTLNAYEDDCEFADPAGSFRGLPRFKRNCSNFGSLLEKSNMKLTKWEDFEDKSIGHWRFSCIMSFPWRPILSATGYTEYYFDAESGRVRRKAVPWRKNSESMRFSGRLSRVHSDLLIKVN
ncbi:hypothetical protein ZIOFF_075421 [Zingiber officinale]|uniref:Uncharacterized protein n=1 Tax=Zingiber officinale TaxID=94328 RepID=A0A8J5BTA4_ZINOF|nr:hypothetical protein ZIOFF_075421 [Zingiber officinale]